MKYSKTPLTHSKYIQIAECYYAVKSEWLNLDSDRQHAKLCHFVATRRKNPTFTAQSLCALRQIPRIAECEMRPHCTSNITKRSDDFIRWHYGPTDPKACTINGLSVVSPQRAICDLATCDSPESLLSSINHCLYKKLFTKKQLLDEIATRPLMRGGMLIKQLLKFASPKSESPLETIGWLAIYNARLFMPKQQVKIYADGSFVARIDMLWELRNRKIILELDGRVKYLTGEDLFAEKRREDKLRSLGYEFLRGDWSDVRNGELVKTLNERCIPSRRNFGAKVPEN